jgi:hypothetical protein
VIAVARRRSTEPRPKREFSKLHVIFADSLVAFVYITNIALSLLDKMPLSDLSVAIITIYGGFATSGYFALQGFRSASLNKNKLRIAEDSEGNSVTEAIPNTQYDGGLG